MSTPPDHGAGPPPQCRSQPRQSRHCQWVSLFFEDTGQDVSNDQSRGRLSNVAKLFKAHRGGRADGLYRLYYSGTTIPDAGEPHGLGSHGNPLGQALYDLSQSLGASPAFAERHIALFGSGVGAALAWRLSLILAQQGIPNPLRPDRPFRIGQDFRIRFLGLFDTLLAGRQTRARPALDGLDAVPHCVESAFHAVAAHERRAVYELQSLRLSADTPLPPPHRERLYPGQHGDITGAYADGDQGRSNWLARIPLNHMLTAAIQQGVPLLTPPQLLACDPTLHADFVVPAELGELQLDYNRRLYPESDLYREWAHHECLYFRWLRLSVSRSSRLAETALQLGVGVSRENLAALSEPRLTDQRLPERRLPEQRLPEQRRLSVRSLARADRALREEYAGALWRRQYGEGAIPDFEPPASVFCLKQDNQLAPGERAYRRQNAKVLVPKPLQAFERDMLTWMQIAEPLPLDLQRFFARYVHDGVAQALDLGDHYLQRRGVFFRRARPWRG